MARARGAGVLVRRLLAVAAAGLLAIAVAITAVLLFVARGPSPTSPASAASAVAAVPADRLTESLLGSRFAAADVPDGTSASGCSAVGCSH